MFKIKSSILVVLSFELSKTCTHRKLSRIQKVK